MVTAESGLPGGSGDAGRHERRRADGTPAGIMGAIAGTVLGGAAAAGAVGAGVARSRVVRARAELEESEAAHPSRLGLLPKGRESSVAADDGTRLAVEEIEPVTAGRGARAHGGPRPRVLPRTAAAGTSSAACSPSSPTRPCGSCSTTSAATGRSGQCSARLVHDRAARRGPRHRHPRRRPGGAARARRPLHGRHDDHGARRAPSGAVPRPGARRRAGRAPRPGTSAPSGSSGPCSRTATPRSTSSAGSRTGARRPSTASGGSAATPCGRWWRGCPSATPTPTPSLVDLVDRTIAETPLDVLTSFANTLSTHDRKAALRGLSQCEVLVAAGTKDVMIPFSHSEVIAGGAAARGAAGARGRGAHGDAGAALRVRRGAARAAAPLHPPQPGAAPPAPPGRPARRRAARGCAARAAGRDGRARAADPDADRERRRRRLDRRGRPHRRRRPGLRPARGGALPRRRPLDRVGVPRRAARRVPLPGRPVGRAPGVGGPRGPARGLRRDRPAARAARSPANRRRPRCTRSGSGPPSRATASAGSCWRACCGAPTRSARSPSSRCAPTTSPPLALYRSEGFEVVGTRRRYYASGADAHTMRRDARAPR